MTVLFWLLSRLPLRVLQALGGVLGWLGARIPGRYSRLLRDNLLIYGLGGLVTPFIGIKLIDMLLTALNLV